MNPIEAFRLAKLQGGKTTDKQNGKGLNDPKQSLLAPSSSKVSIPRSEDKPTQGEVQFFLEREISSEKEVCLSMLVSLFQVLFLTGSLDCLGNWNIEKSVRMTRVSETSPTVWNVSLSHFPLHTPFTYKYGIMNSSDSSSEIIWEDGEKRSATASSTMKIRDQWNLEAPASLPSAEESPESRIRDTQILDPTPTSSPSITVDSVKEMSLSEFKEHKKKIDMAIFLHNETNLRQSVEDFTTALRNTPIPSEVKEESEKLLFKAQNSIKSLSKKDDSQKLNKKSSLRTRARLSHLKLTGKTEEKTKEEFLLPPSLVKTAARTLSAARLSSSLFDETLKCIDDLVELVEGNHSLTNVAVLKEFIAQRMNAINSHSFDELQDRVWKYKIHSFSTQGTHHQMEDRIVLIPEANRLFKLNSSTPLTTFVGIFDGHAGDSAAEFGRLTFHHNFFSSPKFPMDLQGSLYDSFLLTDSTFCEIAKTSGDSSGCTGTCLSIVGTTLTVGNVGDSSAFLYRGNPNGTQAIPLTRDHKASQEDEKERIKALGGAVVWFGGGWRVNGSVAVSRSIGDLSLSQYLVATPHVVSRELDREDLFVVMATDGLWDVITPEEVGKAVESWTDKESNISEKLAEVAIEKGSADDISVAVIWLQEEGKGRRQDIHKFVRKDPQETKEDMLSHSHNEQ